MQEILTLGIDDSKRLSAYKRMSLISSIQNYFYSAIGEIGVTQINYLGIVKSTQMAARQAIAKLMKQMQIRDCFLLCDGFPIPYIPHISQKRQLAIIKGDQKCISIAASSIIAKVYRDKLMKKLARFFNVYRWGRNKGYGTDFHRNIIKQYGMTSLHRKQFVQSWLTNSNSHFLI